MSDALVIQAHLREKAGTGPSRSLRVAGNVPAVMYGKGEETSLISIAQKEADMLYQKSQTRSATIDIELKGKHYVALPKVFSLHPVTDSVEHVDFMLVADAAKELRINIPIRIKGKEKSSVTKQGGVINLVFRSLPCRVEKDKIPPYIEIDITEMQVGTTLRLRDITLPDGVKLLIKDLGQTFLRFTGKKAAVEEVEIKAPDAATVTADAAKAAAKPSDKDAGAADKKDAADKKGKK